MKPITMEQVLKTFKEYFLMTVGMMLYSFAWIGCIMPADGTGGGATGLSRVLCHAVEHWAGISIQIGTMAFLINGVLLLVAGFIIGWNFGVKTVFCVCVISLGLNFWQSVLPEGDFLHLERILSVILGGILAGIGVAAQVFGAPAPDGPASWIGLAAAFDGVFLAAGLLLFGFMYSGDE